MIKGKDRGTFLGCWDEHGHEMHCAHATCPPANDCRKGCADRKPLTVTQEIVNENLEHAIDNGYFLDLSKHTVADIVADLREYSFDCGGEPDEVLTPLVKTWYDARLIGDSQAGKAADC